MTKKELLETIERLKVPDDAKVYVYDDGDLEIITYDEEENELEINRYFV